MIAFFRGVLSTTPGPWQQPRTRGWGPPMTTVACRVGEGTHCGNPCWQRKAGEDLPRTESQRWHLLPRTACRETKERLRHLRYRLRQSDQQPHFLPSLEHQEGYWIGTPRSSSRGAGGRSAASRETRSGSSGVITVSAARGEKDSATAMGTTAPAIAGAEVGGSASPSGSSSGTTGSTSWPTGGPSSS